MANKIQIKRGNYSSLPTLDVGEFGFCTDTTQLFIGSNSINYELLMKNLFNTTTFLYATTSGTPEAKTPTQVMGILSGQASADFSMNSKRITSLLDPSSNQDAATKFYVDNLVTTGLSWLPMVKDKDIVDPPSTPDTGARYWIGGVGQNGWSGHDYDIAEWDGAQWVYTDVTESTAAYVDDENIFYYATASGISPLYRGAGLHATSHVDGTDDIQLATSGQKGLMSNTYASKLDGIEASADVTDATNVDAAGAVMNSDYNANSILAATSDDTPAVLTINEQTVVGRLTGGAISALTGANLWTVLSGTPTYPIGMNSQRFTDLADPVDAQDAATKAYVLANAGGGAFTDLSDVPSDYTDDALKLVRVNSGANGLEFVTVSGTYFEDSPSNGEMSMGPTSNWAYDHNAASTGVHAAGANTLLHSGSTIDCGAFA